MPATALVTYLLNAAATIRIPDARQSRVHETRSVEQQEDHQNEDRDARDDDLTHGFERL
jgi:hypothetical protein